MAPINKQTTSSGYVYEKNNHTVFAETTSSPKEYHNLMGYLKQCSLAHAMFAAHVLQCGLIEAFWATAHSSRGNIVFSIEGKSYALDSTAIRNTLLLPANNREHDYTDVEIVDMLDTINYASNTNHLGKIIRKHLRREWSYYFDAIIKVFSGKISNYDAITKPMQKFAFSSLYDQHFELGELVMAELLAKLGSPPKRIPLFKIVLHQGHRSVGTLSPNLLHTLLIKWRFLNLH